MEIDADPNAEQLIPMDEIWVHERSHGQKNEGSQTCTGSIGSFFPASTYPSLIRKNLVKHFTQKEDTESSYRRLLYVSLIGKYN